jgi:hypothetical protein
MMEEKSQRKSSEAESELRKTVSVKELQTVTHEFLSLLSELNHQQTLTTTTITYLSLIQLLLNIITDLMRRLLERHWRENF